MADQRGSSARSSGTTDRNLPIGVMALQTVLRDSEVFAESCTLWSGSKGESSPADVLVERGSLSASDREHVDRKLAQHGGDAGTGCGPAADHRSAGTPRGSCRSRSCRPTSGRVAREGRSAAGRAEHDAVETESAGFAGCRKSAGCWRVGGSPRCASVRYSSRFAAAWRCRRTSSLFPDSYSCATVSSGVDGAAFALS